MMNNFISCKSNEENFVSIEQSIDYYLNKDYFKKLDFCIQAIDNKYNDTLVAIIFRNCDINNPFEDTEGCFYKYKNININLENDSSLSNKFYSSNEYHSIIYKKSIKNISYDNVYDKIDAIVVLEIGVKSKQIIKEILIQND